VADEVDAGDLEAVNLRKTKIGRQKAVDGQVIQHLLSTEAGRSWAWRFLEFCHVYNQSYVSDPYDTAFNEGQRSIGNLFLADISRYSPESYLLMTKEKADGRYDIS
jgi:hypothetical protein